MGRVKINANKRSNFWKFSQKKDFHGSLEVSGSLAKLPKLWKFSKTSKIGNNFQNLYLSGFADFQKNFRQTSSRVYARSRARNYMEKYIPIGDIYFSNVISLGSLLNFQKIPAKNYDASPLSPAGRLAVILPQKGWA